MSEKSSNNNTGAGKGDKPRNCFSQKFRDNYDQIKWENKKNEEKNIHSDNSSVTNSKHGL